MADEKPPPDVIFIPESLPGTLDDIFERPEVKAITSSRDAPPPPTPQPFPRPPAPSAPAMHGSTIWGGPQWVHNAEAKPVWCETKEQYWALLRRNKLHMLDQQESSTGLPTEPPAPVVLPVADTPHPPVAPMTKHDAEVFGAITAIYQRYGLIESLWCQHCFARHVHHGMRMIVNARTVHLECRAGAATWATPVGETNLVLSSLSNATISRNDRIGGTVVTSLGDQEARPAHLLLKEEAMLIRAYIRVVRARGIEPRWHHKGCWSGNPANQDDAMALAISESQIVCVCKCFQLFDRSVRAGAEEVVN